MNLDRILLNRFEVELAIPSGNPTRPPPSTAVNLSATTKRLASRQSYCRSCGMAAAVVLCHCAISCRFFIAFVPCST